MNTKSDGFKLLLGILAGIAAIVVFGLLLSIAPEFVRGPAPTPTPGGIVAGAYRDVPDVTLINQNDQPMKLSAIQGKPTLLAFGYTHCPDVCPMTLSDFRRVKKSLGDAGDQDTGDVEGVGPDERLEVLDDLADAAQCHPVSVGQVAVEAGADREMVGPRR